MITIPSDFGMTITAASREDEQRAPPRRPAHPHGRWIGRHPSGQHHCMITPVIAGCGVGQTMVNGKCETRVEKRENRRCLRWSGTTCAKFAP